MLNSRSKIFVGLDLKRRKCENLEMLSIDSYFLEFYTNGNSYDSQWFKNNNVF